MTAATSIENYKIHRSSGKLGAQSMEILRFMETYPDRDWSRAEIAEHLDMRLSSVCGRVNEMIHSGDLLPSSNRRCYVTNKTVCPVRLCGLF